MVSEGEVRREALETFFFLFDFLRVCVKADFTGRGLSEGCRIHRDID